MNENLASGDTSAVEQFFDSLRRSEPLEPEKALLAAILEDAIHDYLRYKRARDRDGKERFREAAEWIAGSSSGWTFSFNNVCELLNLDPEYVWRTIRDSAGRTIDEKK